MLYNNCAVNRAKLIDEPIVEMLLTNKYYKSGVSFTRADIKSDLCGVDIVCYSNGIKRNINVKRNSSKYYSSPNFTMSIDKNNLEVFNNSIYVFIDEVADALYIVDGVSLLSYIVNHDNCIMTSNKNSNKSYILIPKKDLLEIIGDNNNRIIRYSKQIAALLEMNRDESKFTNLV